MAAGGALGTALRFGVAVVYKFDMLLATLTVNVLGAFLLALLVSRLSASALSEPLKRDLNLFFGVGLLGGFTTYSAFALDSASLYLGGQVTAGLALGFLTLVLGAAATLLGLSLGSRSDEVNEGAPQ